MPKGKMKQPSASGKAKGSPKERIYQKDYGKIRPKRNLPGIMGRTAWFVERAGRMEGAGSLDRLMRATSAADNMLTQEQYRMQVADELRQQVFRQGIAPERMRKEAMLINAKGKAEKCRISSGKEKGGASQASPRIEVESGDSGTRALFIPINEEVLEYLDLEKMAVTDLADPKNPTVLHNFSYWPDLQVVAGKIPGPGTYQVIALPKHPWLQTALQTLHLHWDWVEHEPAIRKILQKTGVKKEKLPSGIVDRICQLILCASDYSLLQDERLLGEFGLGLPPKFRAGGNICDRCLGDFLGELTILDGVKVVKPPILDLVPVFWPRCSTWLSLGPTPDANFRGIGRVTQISMHPLNTNTLLAASSGGGVWRTTNGGGFWTPLMRSQPTLTMGAVAIAPSNPSVYYAASGEDGGGWNPAWSGIGIYRSNDAGVTWTLAAPVPSTRFSAIVVHPLNPDILYVAGNRGLHKSIDGGATWIANPGMSSLFDGQVTDVVIAHNQPERIYIGVVNSGVHRSTTGGIAVGLTPGFTRLDGPGQLPSSFNAGWIKLAIGVSGAHGSNCVVAKMGSNGSRIFRTLDGGNVWQELAANVATVSFDEWCSIIAVDPQDEDIMYAGAATTLMRTTNGGALPGDWSGILGIAHADQQDMIINPHNPQQVFLANDGGVYRSEDRGTTWTFASGSLAITQLYDIDVSEHDRDVVAGGAQDNGVYYRNTVGQWRHILWGDGTQVAIDPTDPNIFYFSSQNGLPNWLRRSTDGGLSHSPLGVAGLSGSSPWVTIIKLDPTDPVVNPAANRILFVCGNDQLFRSINGGASWQRVEDGAGNPFVTNGTITALEFAPNNPGILYLGTSMGAMYRGINGGTVAGDWSRLDTLGSSGDVLFPNAQIQALAVHATNANMVWAVFGGSGVTFTGRPDMILNPLGISHLFKSTDGGANWTDASGQFAGINLPDVPTSAVALHKSNTQIAYAGTDVGVFKTIDGGMTWEAYNDGLPRCPVTELRMNRTQNRLFAGTMGRGVFARSV